LRTIEWSNASRWSANTGGTHRLRLAALVGGVALLDALNILAGVDLRNVDSATRKHWIVSAMQRAYRDRAVYLGDPDFVQTPVRQLVSKDYAAGQRSSIRPDKALPSDMLPGIETAPVGEDTTHISILDAAGNRVAATMSINLFFGSGDMVRRPACCSTTPWMIFRSSPALRIRSDWSAMRRTPSPRTNGRSPA